jgi:site-specific recombinase XerD
MSPLRQALEDYLSVRRKLGFDLTRVEHWLTSFVNFMEEAGASRITTGLALQWATLPRDVHPHWWRARLGIVRGFARYLATIDPQSEVPSGDLLPAARRRVTPYIYSQAEIAALMHAARRLREPLMAAAVETVIGLMASTGTRVGEALALDRQDVDLKDGALHLRRLSDLLCVRLGWLVGVNRGFCLRSES